MNDLSNLSMDDLRKKRLTATCRTMLQYLTAGAMSLDEFDMFASHLSVGLSETDRELLIAAIVKSLPADVAEGLCRSAFKGAGYPAPALTEDALSDARYWAGDANVAELKAYAMACVEKMSPARRKAFAKWVSEQ